MRNPLSYQATEYDCGPTSLRNAVSFLYNRKDIHPEVIKFIHLYSMDSYNCDGEACKEGTSAVAMAFLANWLNQYGMMKKWPVRCEVLKAEEVFIGQNSRIVAALQQGGAAVLRVMLDSGHYILLTGVKGEEIDAFDPYFWPHDFQNAGIVQVQDRPDRANRQIRWDVFNSEDVGYYNLGPVGKRECVLVFNPETRRDESAIEYTI